MSVEYNRVVAGAKIYMSIVVWWLQIATSSGNISLVGGSCVNKLRDAFPVVS